MGVVVTTAEVRKSERCDAGVAEWHRECRASWCTCWCHDPAPVRLISFGYGHGAPPEAHAVIDVRHHFSDPHVDPALRNLDAYDDAVMAAVLATPGIPELIDSIVALAYAFRAGPKTGPITIAVGCVGGRHRSAAAAIAVWKRLWEDGTFAVGIDHRDINRPVLKRPR